MQRLNKDEFHIRKVEILLKIKEGAVFIYPTDTIYGIGANALNHDAVKKIRDAKNRYEMPFSVIAPSKDWIRENCEINKRVEEWIEKLPGPYTLILKLKNNDAIEQIVNAGMKTIGVRIPDHWITEISSELNLPIVTTSANITGSPFITSLDNLDVNIKSKVDFAINEGDLKGRPSTLVDLTKEEEEIKER